MKLKSVRLEDPTGAETQKTLITIDADGAVWNVACEVERGHGYWKRVKADLAAQGVKTENSDWPFWVQSFL